MPRKRKYEQIKCQFFRWGLIQRNGVWYADGRASTTNPGRHSLGTKDKKEAIDRLPELDRIRAEELGLIARSTSGTGSRPLKLAEGRKLYDEHNARPRIVGGVKKSTLKRYRAIFDKFLPFVRSKGISDWNGISEKVLSDYASHLIDTGYAYKTVHGELTTIKQAFKWLCVEGHLNRDPLRLKLNKADSERAYCYTPTEVAAILEHCRQNDDLKWLLDVLIGLICTGVRIEELVSLKWADIRFDEKTLTIADESGYANQSAESRTTKSSRSRHLPIRRELLDVLRSVPKQDQYIFHGPRGGRLKADTIRNVLVREVIEKLVDRFPKPFAGQRSFEDGRLHSFRHYFCSVCANTGVPERIVMEWLGHADSEMVRHYYHLSNEESRRKMDQLNLLGEGDGRSATDEEQ